MTIRPPGTVSTLLLVDGLGVGDPGGAMVGETESDADADGEADGDAGDVPEVVGEGDAVGVGDFDGSTWPPTALPSRQVNTYSMPGGVGSAAVGEEDFGGGVDGAVMVGDVDAVGLADGVCVTLGVGVTDFDGLMRTGATGGSDGVLDAELADAADADCAATCLATTPEDVTRSWLPLTSRPTRSTAVRVTAVMSTHESNQPNARVSGRPGRRRPPSGGPPAAPAAIRRHLEPSGRAEPS